MPVPPETVKTYPPRGPLQQFRLPSATPLTCFRCGQDKKSKLHTVYYGDWDRRLCNGCYGYLLSIYDVKSGTRPDDDRAEALGELLLKLVDADTARHASQATPDAAQLTLSDLAERFVGTAEWVAGQLGTQEGLEWSPAVIGLCKAVETEVIRVLAEPWREACRDLDLAEDERDQHVGRMAKWCSGRAAKPPELGTISYTLRTLHRSSRHASTKLGQALAATASRWQDATWLIGDGGLADALDQLAKEHRNRAAHLDALDGDDYGRCRDAVLGNAGLLPRLLAAAA